ncbi:9600_t:CDS:2, partial [Dentiscutata heterogama]
PNATPDSMRDFFMTQTLVHLSETILKPISLTDEMDIMELHSSGQIAYWISYYFTKRYGSDQNPTEEKIKARKLLKVVADKNMPKAQHEYAVSFLKDGNILPGKIYCNNSKKLLKKGQPDQGYKLLGKAYLEKASLQGSNEAKNLLSKIKD